MKEINKYKAQANVVDYELHSLGWRAFQDLSVIIMQEIWGNTVQSFCDSHDGGRDGAFYGSWLDGDVLLHGSFSAQCKFTSDQSKSISLSNLKDELNKAERLAGKGLSKIYVLFTNAKLSGATEEELKKAFEAINGIDTFMAFGRDRISLEIQQSPRLRMLVPRIYGLGDLSQIMDERASLQAHAILSALGDDLNKFVRTDVFHRSAKALVDHGFVLLLGEPACGKSTIAAALAVGAIDEWNCSTIKITSPSEFIAHWNPNDSNRFYWIDDAFGATQMDYSSTIGWNSAFPQINAAIRQGVKVLFTSRDYIYNSAKQYLKETALPIVKTSQVVINVQDISAQEREQILYNHIKLGQQPTSFKTAIKPYLQTASQSSHFSPELARRLGNPLFTKKLFITDHHISQFLEKPLDLLLDIIGNLDSESLSALALVFMREGVLLSPIETSLEENSALETIGGTQSGVRSSLKAMDNSLVVFLREDNQYVWRYKHPTIRDAFAQYISRDIEMLEIYLTGAPLSTIIREVSCGIDNIGGVKIIVPVKYYSMLVVRLKGIDKTQWQSKAMLTSFLSTRCNRDFLEVYIKKNTDFFERLEICASFYLGSDVDLVIALDKYKLLPNQQRDRLVGSIKKSAVAEYDPEFLTDNVREFLSAKEFSVIRDVVATEVILNLEEIIDDICKNYEPESTSPEEAFDNLNNAIIYYKGEYIEENFQANLEEMEEIIEQNINELSHEYGYGHEPEAERRPRASFMSSNDFSGVRSTFDDVDS